MPSSKEYSYLISAAVDYLEKKGYDQIRADVPDKEKPAAIVRQNDEESFVPDITARRNGGKCYFDIVTESKSDKLKTAGKWRLFSTLAEHRNGEFYLLVPYGKLSFTNRLLEKHGITAKILKMQDVEKVADVEEMVSA
ncbi:hypothetical protein SAMN05421823_103519 [Catalinimonas alkaloidigena]|uniref:Restriction endonuclease n=1 Tax=Catalinimonas alkaloidigena TaxID=1075417 RepID=A0A1G9ELQ4_9BACT|nr:hypothetical protein [Catalinimonas alkaloidigena]SDK77112.1 hypothetical protein SAMN05421823_103519 [Catalinimonas alkaloidigena]